MEGNARTWFTPKQRTELWARWKRGQCVADIARALERSALSLRLEEREEISRGIAAGRSMRRIAQGLGRSPSTISREIRRNGGCSAYRASWADRRAWEHALRPKPCRLARQAELRWRVAQKLALEWSPEQISGWLKRQFATTQGMQISHETIYRSLFIQTRGVLKKELMVHLRTARQIRPSQGRHPEERTISIRERLTEAEDRAVPGHWGKLPQQLRRSLTWDRGKEMADHKNFTIAAKILSDASCDD